MPLLLAGLHEELGRGLLVLLPEDADARDAAEAVGWFLGGERVALLPSRGVSFESGLAPPPHLVGERYRALDTLASGGLVCASARALADGLPPLEARPFPLELRVGDEPGVDGLAEQLALAGYERVDRVDERGQFAVRGGLVDIFPSTGREPLRVDFFGDEIEQVRAFSPFTQRALHTADQTTVYPAAERRADLVEPDLGSDEADARRRRRRPISSRPSTVRPTSSGSRTTCAASGDEEGLAVDLDGRDRARPVPAGAAASVRGAAPGDRRTRDRRGRERAPGIRPRGEPRRRRLRPPR